MRACLVQRTVRTRRKTWRPFLHEEQSCGRVQTTSNSGIFHSSFNLSVGQRLSSVSGIQCRKLKEKCKCHSSLTSNLLAKNRDSFSLLIARMSGAEKIRKSVRVLSHAHSDSEADTSGHFYSHTNNPPSIAEDHGHRYERLDFADGNQTDDMDDGEKNNDSTRGRSYSLDEFGDQQDPASHLVRTGRQRKKLAARSKGGEFRTKRRKRRVYFCCVSSEIDVQKLFDYLVGAGSLLNGWKYQLHSDVLHLYKAGYEDSNTRVSSAPKIQPWAEDLQKSEDSIVDSSAADILDEERNLNSIGTTHKMNARDDGALSSNNVRFAVVNTNTGSGSELWTDNSRISGIGAQEVFVFDFGAAVFWVSIMIPRF